MKLETILPDETKKYYGQLCKKSRLNFLKLYYLKELLTDNYIIHTSQNGIEGVDKAISIIPDLIISDIMMPMMDGYTLCKKLKTNPITNHIPLILLTAKSNINDKIEGIEIGADAYIKKPFHSEELLVKTVKRRITHQPPTKSRWVE